MPPPPSQQTDGVVWLPVPVQGLTPEPRAAHSLVTSGDHLVVFGGNDRDTLYNCVWMLSTSTWAWRNVAPAGTPPSPRSGHTAVMYGSHMVVFGGGSGWNGETFNDLHMLDVPGNVWYRPAHVGTPPSPRSGHSASLIGSKLFVFGGGDRKRSYNDLHILDLDSMSWTRPSDTGEVPLPRAGHSATSVGHLLLVFGGGSPQGSIFSDFALLDTEFTFYPSDTENASKGRVGGASTLAGAASAACDAVSDASVGSDGVPGAAAPQPSSTACSTASADAAVVVLDGASSAGAGAGAGAFTVVDRHRHHALSSTAWPPPRPTVPSFTLSDVPEVTDESEPETGAVPRLGASDAAARLSSSKTDAGPVTLSALRAHIAAMKRNDKERWDGMFAALAAMQRAHMDEYAELERRVDTVLNLHNTP